jgi:hypothetical protein
MKFNKINRILNVIRSCKTQAQLDNCKTWVKSIKNVTPFEDTSLYNQITKINLETHITQIQTQMMKDKNSLC